MASGAAALLPRRLSEVVSPICPGVEMVLSTSRLYLRRFTQADARLLWELDQDREVMRHISKGQPTPLERIEGEILPRVLSYYERIPPQGCWSAHLRATGEFVGWVHLREDKLSPGEMELGYRLKRSAWGQGLATEASRALVRKGFEEWNTRKVSARALVGNVASHRVMAKAGLLFEEEFVYPAAMLPGWSEQERRAVKYGLTEAQWRLL